MISYNYIDNSNLYIQGRLQSAVERGLASSMTEAQRLDIQDSSWQLDYSHLRQLLCGAEDDTNAVCRLWGSPPPGELFWRRLQRIGFECQLYQRSVTGREKKVDVAIATAMIEDALTGIDSSDSEINLIAGDIDYVPVVETLVARGFSVCVVFWEHAGLELRDAASSFFDLTPHLDYLTFTPHANAR